MPILFRLGLSALIVAASNLSVVAADHKQPATPSQTTIDSLKTLGESYQGALWHRVEGELMSRRSETAASQSSSSFSREGGDGPANATVISGSPFLDVGTTIGKGNNASIPSCLSGGNDTAPDAWYVLTVSEPVNLTAWTTCASTFPSTFDTRLGIFSNQFALLACNDDDAGCSPNVQSRIENQALSAGTYYVVVDGYSGGAGRYQLNVSWAPQPPPCTGGSSQLNAELITSLPFVDQGTTVGACNDIMISCELSGPDNAADYWYKVLIDTTTLLTVSTTCDQQWFDSKIAILDTGLVSLYCNDDSPLCGSKQSRITNASLFPGEYYIVVDGYHLSEGNYEINVDGVPFDAGVVDTLFPDIAVRRDDLYDNEVSVNVQPGRRHLKLSVATPNIGLGKLYLYGVLPANPDGTQDVRQRIFRSDGSFFDRLAGKFIFHPQHDHIHVEGWSQFHLREVLPDSSVGAIVASGAKTSFCILDLTIHDSSLPNYNPNGEFHSCSSTIQGLSVGWADIYSKDLPGQNIDITDVPDGVYWLEAVVDPDTTIMEARETNNASRVLIVIGNPDPSNADSYEPGNSFDEVDARPVGSINSPNLGPCDPQRVIDSLSIHASGNDDFYRFYNNSIGTSADYVRIDLVNSQGDLDMNLYDAGRNSVGSSTTTSNVETISLNGKPKGWYYVRVYGYNGAVNPKYKLTVNPPANSGPAVTVVDPPAGDTMLVHGLDTYKVGWSHVDPEGDECWVSVFVNSAPVLNGRELLLPTSLNTPAPQGFYVVNSAYVPVDTSLYVYCRITDGGTTTGGWSSGTVTFLHHDHAHGMIAGIVIDSDSLPVGGAIVYLNGHEHEDTTIATGLFMMNDVEPGTYSMTIEHPNYQDSTLTNIAVNVGGTKDKVIMLSGCSFMAGDADGSLSVTISDVVYLVNYIFGGGAAPSPIDVGDTNCDGQFNISDAVHLINFIFSGGAPPCATLLSGLRNIHVVFSGHNEKSARQMRGASYLRISVRRVTSFACKPWL